MEKKNKLSDAVTERIIQHLGKQNNNIAIIKHYGTFKVTAEDAKSVLMNYPEVNTYYHHFVNDDMVQSFEPFLNIINNLYSKYYYNEPIHKFLEQFDIYQLQKSFFETYLESGVCVRNEPFIIDEIPFEKKKMVESIANILIKLSQKHPIFIMINNLHMAAKSTISFLQYMYQRADNCNIGIYAAYNELKPILPSNQKIWDSYISMMSDGGYIYEGGAYQVTEDTATNIFNYDSNKIFEYISKLGTMCYALDFEQADYYLENIYSKIEYERMDIDYERKLELYKIYAQIAIYRMDIPVAQRICGKLKEIHDEHPSELLEYEYNRLLTYSYIYSAKTDKGRVTLNRCIELAEKMDDEIYLFKARILENVFKISGWRSTVFFFGANISISEDLVEKALYYKFYNHLAYMYIFGYCNELENFQQITTTDKIDDILVEFAKGINLAKEIGNTYLVLRGYRKNIMLSSTHGMFHVAKYYYNLSQTVEGGNSNIGIADSSNGLGYILCTEHKYEKANEFFNKALDIYMKNDMLDYVAETLYNMSINCMLANDVSNAYNYLLLCVKIIEALKLNDLRVCNIAKIYGLLALSSIKLSLEYNCLLHLDTCRRFLSNCFRKNKENNTIYVRDKDYTGNDDELFLYFYTKGLMFAQNGKYIEALQDMLQAEKHCYKSVGNQFFSVVQLKMSIADLYNVMHETDKRDEYYQAVYEYAKEHNYTENMREIEVVMNCGTPYSPISHKLIMEKYKLEDIYEKNSKVSIIKEFEEVREHLEYVSVWQNILDVDSKIKSDLIENASNAFSLNFSLDSFTFIRFNEKQGEVLYNNGLTQLSEMDLQFLKAYFEKNRTGFVVSNLSKNYNDYVKILDVFGEDMICSMVCNPFFVNEKLDSLFISCIHIKENWNVRKANYLLGEREYNIFNILLRQLLDAIDRMDTLEEIKLINDELEKASITDYLTGLRNRKGFYDELDEIVKVTDQRSTDTGVAILYVDLDNFKFYNDAYGHDVGDLVIKEVADVLKSVVDGDSFAVRYGGDEFLIVLVNCTKKSAVATAQLALDTILSKNGYVSQISNFLGKQVVIPRIKYVTCSIGVAYNPALKSEEDFIKLINNADEALYDIKHTTKNGVSLYAK